MAAPTSSAPPPELPNLRFVEFLASGGFADVFLYEQEFPRQRVAVKVLKQRLGALDRDFVNEANRLAGLSEHPNIVRISAANMSADGRAYLVMEYCPPPHLGVRCRPDGLAVDEALRIGVKVCGAVSAAHRSGVLHRDIKPANILMRASKEPVLIDFGIAGERRGAELDEGAGLSIPYAPPEVLFSDAPGDEISDVYSLGATLYALVAGRSPYEVRGGDNSQTGLLSRMRTGTPPRIGRPDVPEGLEALFQYALARNPQARPQTAVALARALQEVERGLGYRPTDFFDGVVPSGPGPVRREVGDPDGTRAQIQVVNPERSTSRPTVGGPIAETPAAASIPGLEVPDALTGSHAAGAWAPDGLELRTEARQRPATVEPLAPVASGHAQPFPIRVVAAVVVVLAILAVVLASALGGSEDPQDDATTTTTGRSQLPTALSMVSDVSVVRTASGVSVSWTDPDNPEGTSYIVEYEDVDGVERRVGTDERSIELDDVAGASERVCVGVQPTAVSGPSPSAANGCVEAGG